MKALQEAHPGARVELWAEDEHRLGLKPVLRRVWAKRGERPVAPVHHRFQWLYLYGFVHPQSGRTFLPVLPHVNVASFTQALRDFARFAGAGEGHWILLPVDGAGWHRSKKVVLPPGIQLLPLPPYSPELQPAERLWPLTNEGIANQCFPDLAALTEAQRRRCAALQARPEVVRDTTLYSWWPHQDQVN